MRFLHLMVPLIASLVWIPTADSCSVLLLQHPTERVFGRNLDWVVGHGALMVNKRNVQKRAVQARSTDRPVEWVSRYGSLTFTQAALEFPYGGINEMGLVVETLWLDDSKHPAVDSLPTINESQWMQYILDRAATVDEAIVLARAVRISKVFGPLHYMVCDTAARCATFENIDGELVIHTASEMEVNALTNNTYRESLTHLWNYVGFGGKKPLPLGPDSLSRFVRAAFKSRSFKSGDPRRHVWDALASVRLISTQWSIVYDMNARAVEFRTLGNLQLRIVSLADFDFSCRTPVQVADMNRGSGNIRGGFRDFTQKVNDLLLRKSVFLKPHEKELMRKQWTTTRCLEP